MTVNVFRSRKHYFPYTDCVGFAISRTSYLQGDDYFVINYYDGKCQFRLRGKTHEVTIQLYHKNKALIKSIYLSE